MRVYIDNVSVTSCTPPATPSPTSDGPVCSGSDLHLFANTTADSYSWTGPNGFTSTLQNPTVSAATTAASGSYSLAVTVSGCPSAAGTVSATVNATVTPSVSISSDHGSSTCSGQTVTFTATPTNGGASPSYVWKKNGTTVQSGSSATYVDSGLVDQDAIQVVMTSNATCASPTTATSNTITMTISGSTTPSVAIAITGGANPSCSGSSVTFTATPTNGGASPTYAFKVNGSTVQSGSSATYTTTSLANGDLVKVTMTSSDPCASPTTADSSTITMSVSTPASISVQPSNQSACTGGSATFTVTASNATGYQWKKGATTLTNVGSISGATTAALTLSSLTTADSGASYTVVVSSASPCAAVTSSPAATLTVNTFNSSATTSNLVYQGFETTGDTWTFTSTGSGGSAGPLQHPVGPLPQEHGLRPLPYQCFDRLRFHR